MKKRRTWRTVNANGLRGRLSRGLALLGVLLFLAFVPALRAQQNPAEARDFAAAVKAFQDANHAVAEKFLAEFVKKYPESERVSEAVLLQGRALFNQQNIRGAIDLLGSNLTRAGRLADQYQYWIGEAHLRSTNYLAAAENFAALLNGYTNSVRRLEAAYGEAQARFKLRDWPRVIALLSATNGAFQSAAQTRGSDELVVRGHLLLAETLLETQDPRGAAAALAPLASTTTLPELKWWRQYVQCRVEVADRRYEEALQHTTNLLNLAVETGKRDLPAESVALQGFVLQQLNRLDDAAQSFARNLAEAVSADRQREALLRIIELNLAQNKTAAATQALGAFFAKYPADAAGDLALLTLGELQLKEFFLLREGAGQPATNGAAASLTNLLAQARARFDQLIDAFTNSPLVGKAYLDLGWCHWADGQTNESLAAFKNAAGRLPVSEAQAMAKFKVAEISLFQSDPTNAVRQLRELLQQYDGSPRVRSVLFDWTYFHLLRAGLALGDLPVATNALHKLLSVFPESPFGDRSLLLVGQALTLGKQPARAREVLAEFASRFPKSELLPEVELAIARSFAQDRQWPAAAAKYDEWLVRFPTNELRPRAEFNRAWTQYRGGNESNAFGLFTNFVMLYPAHTLAPRAQHWIGDYYYRQENFTNAQISYQRLFENTNWAGSELAYQAKMHAGQAAYARQGYKDARELFLLVINDTTHSNLVADALFALGDCALKSAESSSTNAALQFTEAATPFIQITKFHTNSVLLPLAWGRLGDCYLQLGGITADAKYYDQATNAYLQVINSSAASVSARSQAEIGLGMALEKYAATRPAAERNAILVEALARYSAVLYEKNVRDRERFDPFWLKNAGYAAARLALVRQQPEIAVGAYRRLRERLPALGDDLDRRIKLVENEAAPKEN